MEQPADAKQATSSAATAAFLRVHAQNADSLRTLARAMLKRGQGADAEPLLRRVIELDPARSETLSDLASALAAKGLSTAAVVLYRRVLAVDADLLPARFELASLLI